MPIFFRILFGIIFVIGIINPRIIWEITQGWKYESAEPLKEYLLVGRIMAIIGLIIVIFA